MICVEDSHFYVSEFFQRVKNVFSSLITSNVMFGCVDSLKVNIKAIYI